MTVTDLIQKKKQAQELTPQEIQYLVTGFVKGDIPDYQMAAFLMAVWFNGMSSKETTELTLAMRDSGDTIDLSRIKGTKVDKHSTGGVADTTTLITAPLVAACGGKVAKMSGRGLGHTGGTLDKLESIPGFSISLTREEFETCVSQAGVSVIGQTGNLVPADKMLYSLRDVTATIDNISLIASSIMSKKLAAGADAIVLDVKTGSGAFMKELDQSIALAEAMTAIGNNAGKPTRAVVTDMNQPLGNAIGNSLEVEEAVMILQGKEKGDLLQVSMTLAQQMLVAAKLAETEDQAERMLQKALSSGEALEALRKMIRAQGGNPDVCDDTSLLPHAAEVIQVKAEQSGVLTGMRNDEIGMSSLLLGAGRKKKEDTIDPAVGIWMKKRLSDKIMKGDILAEFHVNKQDNVEEAVNRFKAALTISDGESWKKPPLVYKIIV